MRWAYTISVHCYLGIAMLSIYTPIKKPMLVLLALFSCYFSVCMFFLSRKYLNSFNKHIFMISFSILFSAIVSGAFSYALINILSIFGMYYILSVNGEYVLKQLSKYIIFISIVNAFLYFWLPAEYQGAKIIGGFVVNRVQLDILPLSIASIISMISFILAGSLKNSLLAFFVRLINILLIFKLGKLSVIFSLVITYIVTIVLVFFSRYLNEKSIRVLLKPIYIFICSFPFAIVYFKDSLNDVFVRLLTFRVDIYDSFLSYSFNNHAFLFGNGFVNNSLQEYLVHPNPHNQILGIFFTLGIIGLLAYVLAFLKMLQNVIGYMKRGVPIHLNIFIALTLLMQLDSYFVLTVFPMYALFFIFYLIRSPISLGVARRFS